MRNLLLLPAEISKWLRAHSGETHTRQAHGGPRHAEARPPSPFWKKLATLLSAQTYIPGMEAREARNFSTSIKPQDLDMALRELRLAQKSTLNKLEHDGAIAEEALNKLRAQVGEDSSAESS